MSPEFFVAFIALLGHFFYYLQFAICKKKKTSYFDLSSKGNVRWEGRDRSEKNDNKKDAVT